MAAIHDLIVRVGREEARSRLMLERDRSFISAEIQERKATAISEEVDKASALMLNDDDAFQVVYSGFAILSLPHKALPNITDAWERSLSSGKYLLRVEPGRLPIGGEWRNFGVPYGSRARLILLYLQTQALRQGSREIRLGSSLYDWLSKMRVPINGNNYKAVRDQANRIRAAKLAFSMSGLTEDGRSFQGFKQDFIVTSGILFDNEDVRQPRLWDDTVILSETFYETLKAHPLPVNEAAIRAISNESWSIDMYLWLSYRLWRLERPTLVSWAQLREQFAPSASYARLSVFRLKFLPVLRSALAVYPEAKVDLESKIQQGIILYPSPPSVPRERIDFIGNKPKEATCRFDMVK